MKCPKCQMENKETAKNCRKCGTDLSPAAVLWKPTWRWHATVLGVIYIVLLGVYVLLNSTLKPYLRQIPADITPWLHETRAAAEKVG